MQGQKLLCELTGKPATIVVNYFGVPYNYADRATLELDWNGIKEKIAQLLVPLRQVRKMSHTQQQHLLRM